MGKSILTLLGTRAAASAIDPGIQKKIHGSGYPSSSASRATTLIIPNDEIIDIMKIIQVLEDFNILLKEFTKTIKNEKIAQKGGILSML